jgi:hypothetical protein
MIDLITQVIIYLIFAHTNFKKIILIKSGIKIVFIYLFTCVSCKQDKKNGEILDAKTMAILISELQFAEAKANRMSLNGMDSSKVAFHFLEKKIFKKYKTDSLSFVKSFDFYAKNKSELLNIYKTAEDLLTAQKDSLNKPNNEKPGSNSNVQ